jgi:hypothetical protein
MGEQEEKGFVFKDRRKMSLDETEKESSGEEMREATKKEEESARQKFEDAVKTSAEAQGPVSLPEVSFVRLGPSWGDPRARQQECESRSRHGQADHRHAGNAGRKNPGQSGTGRGPIPQDGPL